MSPTAGRIEQPPVRTANLELERLIDSLVADSASGTTRSDPTITEGPMAEANAALAVSRSEDVAPARGPNGAPQSATERSMAGPAEPPLAESGIELFSANLQLLNKLELDAGGSDLFSGIEAAEGSEVRVGTTAAWHKLPSVGQDAYVKTLLNYWVSARGGKGPAVVRLVNASGQVLVEKSWQ